MCTSAEPAFDENAQPNTPSKHSSKGSDIIRSDSVPQSRERPALTPLSVDSWVRGETEAVDDAESFEDVASQEEYALCASDRFSASDRSNELALLKDGWVQVPARSAAHEARANR
jgi:hypothetical protein